MEISNFRQKYLTISVTSPTSKSMERRVRKSVTPSGKYGCPKQIFTKLRLFQHCFVKNIYIDCFEKATRDLTATLGYMRPAGWTWSLKMRYFLLLTESLKIQFLLNTISNVAQLQIPTG